jgi:2'-5' RNA ligase
MRLFLGIPLPASTADQLSRISLRYQAPDDNLRWYPPESWHITLQFLGSVQPDRHARILSPLRTFRHPPVSITLGALGFFDRVGVFFAQVALTPDLLSLQQRVAAATLPCGFPPETRPYHPHITLARTKGRAETRSSLQALKLRFTARPYPAAPATPFTAREFVLYQSIASPSGSRYEILDRFPLG